MLIIIDRWSSSADGGWFGSGLILDEVSHVHWHLLNLCVVERLNVLQRAAVVDRHEVDRNTLATESSTSTNPINSTPILLTAHMASF